MVLIIVFTTFNRNDNRIHISKCVARYFALLVKYLDLIVVVHSAQLHALILEAALQLGQRGEDHLLLLALQHRRLVDVQRVRVRAVRRCSTHQIRRTAQLRVGMGVCLRCGSGCCFALSPQLRDFLEQSLLGNFWLCGMDGNVLGGYRGELGLLFCCKNKEIDCKTEKKYFYLLKK